MCMMPPYGAVVYSLCGADEARGTRAREGGKGGVNVSGKGTGAIAAVQSLERNQLPWYPA